MAENLAETHTIESLLPALRRQAFWIRDQVDAVDLSVDDLMQIMVVFVLEKAAQDATFLRQTKNFVVNLATWRAQNSCRAQRARRVKIAFVVDEEGDDGDEDSIEQIPDPVDYLERAELSERLAEQVAGLTPRQQMIASLLAQGYSKSETAGKLGCRPELVSREISRMRASLVL